jgi:hypothetical protein
VSDEEWAYLTPMREDVPQREYALRELLSAVNSNRLTAKCVTMKKGLPSTGRYSSQIACARLATAMAIVSVGAVDGAPSLLVRLRLADFPSNSSRLMAPTSSACEFRN